MRGIIAECHYDGGRNYVSMIRGHKRYILQPPSQCKHLKMLKYPHPSARHSSVDWSNRYVPYERHSGEDNVADEAFDRAASINVRVSFRVLLCTVALSTVSTDPHPCTGCTGSWRSDVHAQLLVSLHCLA